MPANALTDIDLSEFGYGRAPEEEITSRDEDDVLIRRERATREQFKETVRMVIDGFVLESVPKAVPKTDSAGNKVRGSDGELVARNTTIYDAAAMLVGDGRWTEDDLRQRLPILCHQPHLHPVGACRMCSVHVSLFKKRTGKVEPGRKLLPACHQEVGDGMIVTTRLGAERFDPARKVLAGLTEGVLPAEAVPPAKEKMDSELTVPQLVARHVWTAKDELAAAERNAETVKKSVGLLAEFLLADHRHQALSPADPADPYKDGRYENELEAVARSLGVAGPRPGLPGLTGSRNTRAAEDPTDTRSRRLPLDVVRTEVEPETLRDPAARGAWAGWNELVDEAYPYSSRTVVVDHDRCILCDRCARACSEVKPFKVIGHTGKGYTARVSFDTDKLMGESSCVQCGECMISCPTGALSLRRRVQPRNWKDSLQNIAQNPNTPFPEGSEFLSAEQMRDVRLRYRRRGRKRQEEIDVYPFRTIPFAYLKWNEGAVRRIRVAKGTERELCRKGEYGSTAFLLDGSGTFRIHLRGKGDPGGELVRVRDGHDLVLGEMACLTNEPRTATVVAVAGPDADAFVYEVTRNILDMMQRTESAKRYLREAYTTRAIENALMGGEMLKGLPKDYDRQKVADFLLSRLPPLTKAARLTGGPVSTMSDVIVGETYDALTEHPALAGLPEDARRAAVDYLYPLAQGPAPPPKGRGDHIEFYRLDPGQMVVKEGDTADDFYLVGLGFLKVFRTVGGRDQVVAPPKKKTDYFGEVALLRDKLRRRGSLPAHADTGKRTASVAALDPSEVVRIPGEVFEEMCRLFPEVEERLMARAEEQFGRPAGPAKRPLADAVGRLGRLVGLTAEPADPAAVARAEKNLTPSFVEQGLYMGQRTLVLDLVKCTRCDECTKACADSHDGRSRLIREGMRFGDFLVATSCRSCHKPYCMEGCPVDAIHRKGKGLEVVIENHCIGCGLCEKNCPYGAIQMTGRKDDGAGLRTTAAVPRQAVNCDLCGGGTPYCVSACPHDAAHRWDGATIFAEVKNRAALAGG